MRSITETDITWRSHCLQQGLTADPGFAPALQGSQVADVCIASGGYLWMGSQDFGFMLKQRPGCCFLLAQSDEEHRAVCHDAVYDFNSWLQEIGAKFRVRLVERRLGCG
jgi:hippurate hydrolase